MIFWPLCRIVYPDELYLDLVSRNLNQPQKHPALKDRAGVASLLKQAVLAHFGVDGASNCPVADIEAVYEEFVATLDEESMPQNTERGAHYLDRSVIEAYCRTVHRIAQFPFQTVRGSFPEGDPIYTGSKLLRKAHTQIAVRDQSCIFDLHLVEFP